MGAGKGKTRRAQANLSLRRGPTKIDPRTYTTKNRYAALVTIYGGDYGNDHEENVYHLTSQDELKQLMASENKHVQREYEKRPDLRDKLVRHNVRIQLVQERSCLV